MRIVAVKVAAFLAKQDSCRAQLGGKPRTGTVLGSHTVPVFIREGLSDAEAAAIVLDHYQSAALNAIDEAQGFDDQLQELGGHGQYGAIARLAVRLRFEVTKRCSIFSAITRYWKDCCAVLAIVRSRRRIEVIEHIDGKAIGHNTPAVNQGVWRPASRRGRCPKGPGRV